MDGLLRVCYGKETLRGMNPALAAGHPIDCVMKIVLPELCLVVLMGPSGSGKSTFARRCFRSTEVLSSDFFRGLVCDDENDQSATKDAFDLLHAAAAMRLARRRFTVVDATNIKPAGRKPFLELARRYHYLTAAIAFNLPPEVCQAHDQARADRQVGPAVIRSHSEQFQRALAAVDREGFRQVFVLRTPEEAAATIVERQPLELDQAASRGPFDLIGDVHGCFDELGELFASLGYQIEPIVGLDGRTDVAVQPPPGRTAIFVGDLVDRGPNVPAVLRLVMGMVAAGTARCVVGNHDDKLLRHLRGNAVQVSHGLAESLRQLERESDGFRQRVREFLEGLPTHYLLDGGRLVVAHAGLKEQLQGRVGPKVRSFCLYGETTGEADNYGMPVRLNWAADYHGAAAVVYGHTPVATAEWVNRTLNIDTGCVFGGRLTALRWPEKELISVPARRVWCEPGRPFLPPEPVAPAADEGSVRLDELSGFGARSVE
jgi:protein phosphatase